MADAYFSGQGAQGDAEGGSGLCAGSGTGGVACGNGGPNHDSREWDDGRGQGNEESEHPVLSADGRLVVFESGATNLVPGNTNGVSDIFVHDRGPTVSGDPETPNVNWDGRADSVLGPWWYGF